MIPIYAVLIGFLILVLLPLIFAKSKGALGEKWVSQWLKNLPDDNYYVLNDVLIETQKGSSQIDHVVISKIGIFVIETKNFRGWIHGSEKSEYWTQTIYKSKNSFRNPVKQNWSHVYALKELLNDVGKIQYFPIVVFAGTAELRNVHSRVPVIYDNELLRQINSTTGALSLSENQRQEIVQRLGEATLHGGKKKREHIRYAKSAALKTKYAERAELCPRCGNKLVVRNGKYGKFFGCSNFPECKYTRDIKDR